MNVDLLEFVTDSFLHSGIQALILDKTLKDISCIDYGFRRKMAADFDYAVYLNKLILHLKEGVHFLFEDDMKLYYLLFRFPSDHKASDNFRLLSIGPVMPKALDYKNISSIMEKNTFLPHTIRIIWNSITRFP